MTAQAREYSTALEAIIRRSLERPTARDGIRRCYVITPQHGRGRTGRLNRQTSVGGVAGNATAPGIDMRSHSIIRTSLGRSDRTFYLQEKNDQG